MPIPLSLQLLTTSSLLVVSMNLPILCISYKWNHTACGHQWLTSFSEHESFKIHPCRSMYHYFMPFYCQIISHLLECLLSTSYSVNPHKKPVKLLSSPFYRYGNCGLETGFTRPHRKGSGAAWFEARTLELPSSCPDNRTMLPLEEAGREWKVSSGLNVQVTKSLLLSCVTVTSAGSSCESGQSDQDDLPSSTWP